MRPGFLLAALAVIGILGFTFWRRDARTTVESVLTPQPKIEVQPEPDFSTRRELGSTRPNGSVVINEIYYHPLGENPLDEWIELFNARDVAVDVSGWRISGGVTHTFEAGTTITPGEHQVVCADARRTKRAFGLTRAIGDWTGELSDRGERIALLDASGSVIDAISYSDSGAFSPLADGGGSSLERRSPFFDSSDPRNWGASSSRDWVRVRVVGEASSRTLYLYLNAPGVAYVDDLSLRTLRPDERAVWSSDFESGLRDWTPAGTHAGSTVTTKTARTGRRCLKVVAAGPGSSRENSVFGASFDIQPRRSYILEFWVRFESSATSLTARFSNARNERRDLLVTVTPRGTSPGGVNSLDGETLPPLVHPVYHRRVGVSQNNDTTTGDFFVIEAAVRADGSRPTVIAHLEVGSLQRTPNPFRSDFTRTRHLPRRSCPSTTS